MFYLLVSFNNPRLRVVPQMPSDCRRMGETPKVQLEGGDPRRRYQVTLMGGARVGKSTIVSHFLYDKVSFLFPAIIFHV